MPLDGHSYLVAQGWGGKGTGLRQGAISRPLAIPQKKNLAGLGKDRDEAFPFWDHLFTAAAKSIQVKCLSDDDEDGDGAPSSNDVSLKRTSTGIFSARRPIVGTPADSGTTTPNEDQSSPQIPRLSLMAQAKRDAAKRGLYSRFFRGPVLGPETIAEEEKRLASLVSEAFAKQNSGVQSITVTEQIELRMADEQVVFDLQVSRSSKKKRKSPEGEDAANEDEAEPARKERKRCRKEKRMQKEAKAKRRKGKKEKAKAAATVASPESTEASTSSSRHSKNHCKDDEEEKLERRRGKEKKALRKQQGDAVENAITLDQDVDMKEKNDPSSKLRKEHSSSRKSSKSNIDSVEAFSGQQEKKKRKRTDSSNESS